MIRRLLSRRKLCLHTGGERRAFVGGIKRVKRRKFAYQLNGGLFTDTRNAGNIVRRIAHQCFYVDEVAGRKPAVGLGDLLFVVKNRLARGAKQDKNTVVDQLERIAVARQKITVVPLVRSVFCRRSQNVVGFVALERENMQSHKPRRLFGRLELCVQLLGHSLARRLVKIARLVPKGRRVKIKGDSRRVGRKRFQLLCDRVDKAVKRVGRPPVPRGHGTHAVKRAV